MLSLKFLRKLLVSFLVVLVHGPEAGAIVEKVELLATIALSNLNSTLLFDKFGFRHLPYV